MTPVGPPSYLLPDDGRVHLVGVGGADMPD